MKPGLIDADPAQPTTSVILIAGDQRARAALALRSLLSQAGIENAEVILFDCGSRADMTPLPGSDHPSVRTIRWLERRPYGVTCAEGARQARGQYVAYLEEHCQALPGYLTGIENALGGGWAAVGAEVHSYHSDLRFSNAIWLMHYPVHLRPNARRRVTHILVGHNAAYQRRILLDHADDLEELLENDAVLHSLLWRQGHRLGIDPTMKILHANEKAVSVISRGYYLWHRTFASNRLRHGGWPPWYKALRVLSVPLMPLVRWGRIVTAAVFQRPADLPLVLFFSPHILITQSAAAAGTLAGYLFGPGDLSEFASYEIDVERDLPALE